MDPAKLDELLSKVAAIEGLLRSPETVGNVDQATRLALSVARNAPSGAISNLAMLVMSAASQLGRKERGRREEQLNLQETLSRLREALESVKKR